MVAAAGCGHGGQRDGWSRASDDRVADSRQGAKITSLLLVAPLVLLGLQDHGATTGEKSIACLWLFG
jgi:hypothetical protein